jgi:hypothetical protein
MAVTSEFPSLRGASCFVLGLISRSSLALTILEAAGWKGPMRLIPTVVVPIDSNALFHFKSSSSSSSFFAGTSATGIETILAPSVKSAIASPSSSLFPGSVALVGGEDDDGSGKFSHFGLAPPLPPFKKEWKAVFKHIAYMSNHIQQKEGHMALMKLKKRNPKMFEDCALFLHVHESLLARYTIPLVIRRFFLNMLFEVPFDSDEQTWRVVDGEILKDTTSEIMSPSSIGRSMSTPSSPR